MQSQYENYENYTKNDPVFLFRVLSGKLEEDQEKIYFEDGSTYWVEGGHRYLREENGDVYIIRYLMEEQRDYFVWKRTRFYD